MSHQPDVSATLGDLERKLRDLERELAGVSGGGSDPQPADREAPAPAPPAPPAQQPPFAQQPSPAAPPPEPEPEPEPERVSAAPVPVPAPPAATDVPLADPEARQLVAEAKASLGGLHRQLDDLVRVREALEASTRELMDEYRRVLGSLDGAPSAAPTPASQPSAPPASAPATAAPAAAGPVAPPADPVVPARPAPAEAPASMVDPASADAMLFSGQITVDAGPFSDIGTLSAFEQALGQVPGTEDVYVRGFEGSRALIDVVLGGTVALGAELRRTATVGFSLAATGPDHVSITIGSAARA